MSKALSPKKIVIFRSFVIDDVVEGNRVNVRLAPDREAPVIAQLSTGDAITGSICEDNNKWLKIPAPEQTQFYIAKEFIEYAGNPELKLAYDKRKSTVKQLMNSADLLVKGETSF